MATVLRTQKALMTKRINAISEWIRNTTPLLDSPTDEDQRKRVHKYRMLLSTCEDHIQRLESSLNALATAHDNVEASSKDEEEFTKYIDNALDIMMTLQNHRERLSSVIYEAAAKAEDQVKLGEEGRTSLLPVNQLPPIPIPTFTGRRWEWDNFWALFEANVHEQKLSPLQKFNYLLSSLSGEAKQSIARFQVTAANYTKALEHLKKRYGQNDDIVVDLHKSLKTCSATSARTECQRQLFEQLSAIATQLKDHGEHVDSYIMVNTILQKFHTRIQKAAMDKIIRNYNYPTKWTVDAWLDTIDEIISQEEKCKEMMSIDHTQEVFPQKPASTRTPYKRIQKGCEYCAKQGHRWNSCQDIPTPSAKRTFLMNTHRCLNCGSSTHQVTACSSGNCRLCNGRHHTAICTRTSEQLQNKEIRETPDPRKATTPQQPKGAKQTPTNGSERKPTRSSKQLAVATETQQTEHDTEGLPQDTVVLQAHKQEPIKPATRNKVVLLAGMAQVLDSQNGMHDTLVLLDTGSELSFISNELADNLAIPTVESTTLSISTFSSQLPAVKQCDITELKMNDIEGRQHSLRLHKTEHITDEIEQADLGPDDLAFIAQHTITLSLPKKTSKFQPQILLGCDYLWNFILPIGKLILPSGLQLIPTRFGYIISGCQAQVTTEPAKALAITSSKEEHEIWDQYWALESSGTNEFTGPAKTEQQKLNEAVLKNFRETIEHKDDGYYVRLPWKDNYMSLPDNKSIAVRRLHKVLNMYEHDPATLQQYDSIFKEQLDKGIIEEVPNHSNQPPTIVHYLPHQAVITPSKETTKMRIVFDASAHYKDKPCLNDVLHQGPTMLPDMISILLRFRTHNNAIISDVEKAFLQVRLQERDRDATRCIWVRDIKRPPTHENIVIYRFTRVTFGLNTSPFLLAATIDFHLDNATQDKDIGTEIKQNLYVDNLIIGAETQTEALDKYHKVKTIFNSLNMNLREFLSNNDDLNENIDVADRAKTKLPKVLGIQWHPKNDTMLLKGTMCTVDKVTKRTVTRQLASVYDPLGLMVPVLLPAKVFVQSLWREAYAWDTILPPQLQQQWREISSSISTFYKEVERKTLQRSERHTMFVFTDASKIAMAACVYIGSPSSTNLIIAKSKLPTLKAVTTIPKLEMNALTLGTRLAHFTYSSLRASSNVHQILFFSDSEIALGWIKAPPDRKAAGVLVTNRLEEIRRIVKDLHTQGVQCLFGHIPTTENPADFGTRGFDITSSELWWKGPQLIQGDITRTPEYQQMFPIYSRESSEDEDTVLHTMVASLAIKKDDKKDERTIFDLTRYNNLHKAQRVVAYTLRFIRRTRRNTSQPLQSTTSATFSTIPSGFELQEAKKAIIRDHQRAFVNDNTIKTLKNLNIQRDNDGILRCYGRLQHAAIPQTAKTPVFIAPRTALARLIIIEAHNNYHQGIAHTMATVRQTYWIPKLRQQTSQLLRKCVACQRFNNMPYRYPETTNLPERRVQRARPFQHIGLDYFGPLTIAESSNKAYGCIFTCATTRLIHLELVEDMTTEKYLNALRRFFARRGIPKTITCDNAPTFLLGEKILHEALHQVMGHENSAEALAQREIMWNHITPYAPWQGGFYERLIRSIKESLYKTLGRRKVSFDVLRTMLTEIEATLNTRPLTYQEESWDQQPIIRPIDFIQKDMIVDYPLNSIGSTKDDPTYHTPEEALRLATQEQVENALKSSVRLTEDFWRIWSAQYLTSLREHHKRNIDSRRGTGSAPKEGTIVILPDPDQPRNMWNIGRISDIKYEGQSPIREITIELPNKRKIRRPINKVIPLEIDTDNPVSEQQTTHEETPVSERTTLTAPDISTTALEVPATTGPASGRPYNLRRGRRPDYARIHEEGVQPPSQTEHCYLIRVTRIEEGAGGPSCSIKRNVRLKMKSKLDARLKHRHKHDARPKQKQDGKQHKHKYDVEMPKRTKTEKPGKSATITSDVWHAQPKRGTTSFRWAGVY